MNIKNYLYSSILLLSGLWTTSCTEQFEKPVQGEAERGLIIGRVAHFMVDGESSSVEGEDRISEMKACVFADGKLTKVYDNIQVADGSFRLTVKETSGTLYLVANAEEAGAWHDMSVGSLTEEEWKQRTVTLKEGKAVSYFTGSLSLDEYMGSESAPLILTRGVARFDLKMGTNEGVKVNSIRLEHVANKAYFLPQSEVSSPETDFVSMEEGFAEPLAENKPGIFYVYEQDSKEMKVVLEVTVDGAPKTLEAKIPSTGIKRNAVYTLNLHRDAVNVKVDEWEYEEDIELTPGYTDKIVIDTEKSELGNAQVTENRDGLWLSYQAASITLALDCDNELELMNKDNLMIDIQQATDGQGKAIRNTFHITKKKFLPGTPAEVGRVYFRRRGLQQVYPTDCIELDLQNHPVVTTGMLVFDDNSTLDFKDYKDGTLGTIMLPEGATLAASAKAYEDEEVEWLKVYEPEIGEGAEKGGEVKGVYTVEAGWRPNDVKAKGQEQVAILTVRYVDGQTEKLYIKRKNYSLPVVNIGGEWWCKFNLRGNVKSFEDQIEAYEDNTGNLEEYLKTCTAKQYLWVLGDQYIGGNPQGLKLAHDGTKFYYEGYSNEGAKDFSEMLPTEMAPSGYQLPTFEQLHYFSASENYALKGNGSFADRNDGTKKVWHTSYSKQNLDFSLGANYPAIAHYAFYSDVTQTRLVLCGLGYGAGNDASDANHEENTIPQVAQFLVATCTTNGSGKTWMLEGWPTGTSGGNGYWFKSVEMNRNKTRVIRCIKSLGAFQY